MDPLINSSININKALETYSVTPKMSEKEIATRLSLASFKELDNLYSLAKEKPKLRKAVLLAATNRMKSASNCDEKIAKLPNFQKVAKGKVDHATVLRFLDKGGLTAEDLHILSAAPGRPEHAAKLSKPLPLLPQEKVKSLLVKSDLTTKGVKETKLVQNLAKLSFEDLYLLALSPDLDQETRIMLALLFPKVKVEKDQQLHQQFEKISAGLKMGRYEGEVRGCKPFATFLHDRLKVTDVSQLKGAELQKAFQDFQRYVEGLLLRPRELPATLEQGMSLLEKRCLES